jgi:lysophospholipase L1-like esterase
MRYTNVLALLLLVSANIVAKDQVTVYLAGDSTMAQKLPEKRPETGWGEALGKYFKDGAVRIDNHAQNGRSTKSFIAEGRWQVIVDKLKQGDYVFIQFGHNDESKDKGDRYTPPAEFRQNLIRFINDVRAKKAIPVLLTPLMRRRFDKDGNFQDTHGEYPDLVRSVAAEKKVALLDMHRSSEKVIKQYGPEGSRKLFLQLAPGENPNYPKGVEDNTHFRPLGADEMARLAVAAIREQRLGLAKYLKKERAQVALPTATWSIDRLDKIGGQATTAIGTPQVIETANGKAMLFDGVDNGLVVNTNPVAAATAFTIEAVFRPDVGGTPEQRWLHIQEGANDNRVLLEIRLAGDQWFLDTFIKSGENKLTLYSEKFKHKVGEWYHIALVFDGTTMRDFVDGKEELSGALVIQPLGVGNTSIGVRMNRVFWFKGAVRKTRFTPRALSPREFMVKK